MKKAEVDNTLRDLQNSSYPTAKAEVNNCFIIHLKYFPVLKGVSPSRSLFFLLTKITQPRPQVFSVSGSITCSGLHFWRHWLNMTKILFTFGQQQLFMVNYETETAKYFEWIIVSNYWMRPSRIWRILQIKEGVIHRGRITPSEICRILHILRKPNSIIALLFIQNISNFLKEFRHYALSFSAHQI